MSFIERVAVRAPSGVNEAIRLAARGLDVTPGDYVREAVARSLEADGHAVPDALNATRLYLPAPVQPINAPIQQAA